MCFMTVSLILSLVGVVIAHLFVKQYKRVQKRDTLRRRVQQFVGSISARSSKSIELDPFDHSLYWYPVAFSHEVTVESKKPFACSLLNEPLCLYRTKNGDVVCVLDLCPHRSAPLSLGQMTKDGHLECIYHGWQYGNNGQCVYIPSVSKVSRVASFVCARSLPVHEQYGFIWIWPGKRDLAHSDFIPHDIFSDLQRINGPFIMSPEYSRSLDIPYELMVDNLLDMAHIDFTHDGTIGKRVNASRIQSRKLTPSLFSSLNSESFSYEVTRDEYPSGLPPIESSVFSFIPPCFIRLNHKFRHSQRLFVQIFIIIPSGEKRMRLLTQFYRNFARFKWIEYIPSYDYWTDRMNNKVVEQDVLLLNGIHENMTNICAKPLGKIVSADAPIRAFRRFYSTSLSKFQTIYVERSAWMKKHHRTSADEQDPSDSVDIEDIGLS